MVTCMLFKAICDKLCWEEQYLTYGKYINSARVREDVSETPGCRAFVTIQQGKAAIWNFVMCSVITFHCLHLILEMLTWTKEIALKTKQLKGLFLAHHFVDCMCPKKGHIILLTACVLKKGTSFCWLHVS